MTQSPQHKVRGRDRLATIVGASIHAGRTVALVGNAGIGKSLLANYVATTRVNARVLHLSASVGLSALPLGFVRPAINKLDGEAQAPEVLAGAIEDLGRYDIIVVDDADATDDLSALVLAQAAQHRSVALLVTMRTGRRLPIMLETALNGPDGAIHVLDRLDESAVRQVINDLAGGTRVSAALGAEIERLAAGNPLHVRELVLGGHETGRITSRSDVVELDGPLDDTPRITHLIGSRIQALSRSARTALEACLVATALPRSLVDKLDPDGGCYELERRMMLKPLAHRPAWVGPAHPLVQTWTKRVDSERLSELYLLLHQTDDEPNRTMLWRVRAGLGLSADEALQACGPINDMFDAGAAMEVLSAAPRTGPIALAQIETGLDSGDPNDTTRQLEALLTNDDETTRASAAIELSKIFAYVNAEPLKAREQLAECAQTLTEPGVRARVQAHHASLCLLTTPTSDDLAMAIRALKTPGTDDAVIFEASVAAVVLLATSGALSKLAELEQRCVESLPGAAHTAGWSAFLFTSSVGWMMACRGETEQARTASYRLLARIPSNEVIARTSVGNTAAWFELLTGDIEKTAALAEQTWRPSIGADVFAFAAPARYQVIWWRTMLGQHEAVEALGPPGPDPGPTAAPIFRVMWAASCDALALADDPDASAAQLLALDMKEGTPAGFLRTVALRTLLPLGSHASDRLILEQAARVKGPNTHWLPSELGAEVQARLDGDGAAMRRSSIAHATSGRWLMAAQAAALASGLQTNPSSILHDEWLLRHARENLGSLAQPWAVAEPTFLTARQWDVVDAVLHGQTTKEAAAQLFIAPRTVETHLAKVFERTGLRSRRKLRELLVPLLQQMRSGRSLQTTV